MPNFNNDQDNKILEEFPPHNYQQWREAAEKLLKGAPFEKKLLTKTYENITLNPIYHQEDIEDLPHLGTFPGSSNFVRGSNYSGNIDRSWRISQTIKSDTLDDLNEKIKDVLKKGQTEINLLWNNSVSNGLDQYGINFSNLLQMKKVFQDIDLTKHPIFFRSGQNSYSLLPLLVAYCKQLNISQDAIKGCLANDPIGYLARQGELPDSLEKHFKLLTHITQTAKNNFPGLQTISVDTSFYTEAGSTITNDLAFALSTGVEYLRGMSQFGLPIENIVPQIRFIFSIGGNFFMEIAKLRAARYLWSKVLDSFEVKKEAQSIFIHAQTTNWNKTLFDPHVNILRSTTEGFSAIVGGCDSLQISPFNELFGPTTEQSERLARNTQLILEQECELKNIIDPAGGSWYIECLTDQLASKAWDIFQKIEKEGGMIKSLRNGSPQQMISEVAGKKSEGLEKRRDVLVGTNMFPNASEEYVEPKKYNSQNIELYKNELNEIKKKNSENKSLDQLKSDIKTHLTGDLQQAFKQATLAFIDGATIEEITDQFINHESLIRTESIPQTRLASPFEELRISSSKFKKAHGAPPTILQLNMGPSRYYRARADWTSSFFQVGGFNVIADTDFYSTEMAINKVIELKSDIVVITSTDDQYISDIPKLAPKIKEVFPNCYLIVAGAAGENESSWKENGIDDFVNIKVNNYKLLKKLLNKIGALA